MRRYHLITILIGLLLAFAAPAAAQGNAVESQYDLTPCSDVQNVLCTQSIRDGFEAMTEDSAKKAEAVGAVFSGDAPGSEDDSEKDSGKGSKNDDSGSDAESNSTTARAAGITELPNTGGASLAVLGAGALLASGGMLLGLRILR